MLKNYFITAIRNLSRNRQFTLLNVFGLALGISAALVLFKIVIFENSFDQYQSNYERIYRFIKTDVSPNKVETEAGMPNPFAEVFAQDYPDLGQPIRTFYVGENQMSVQQATGDWTHFEQNDGIAFVDKEFFDAFDYEWKIGDPKTALDQPKSAVISESMAAKYFGVKDSGYDRVLGKEMKLNNELIFFITGVVSDPPLNTSLPFKFMIEYESVEEIFPFYQPDSWTSTSSNAHVYFLMAEEVTKEQVEDVLPDLVEKYLTAENADTEKSFSIQAMPDFHFSPELGTYGQLATEKESLAIPIAVGVFLILTACVNFINLSTALAIKRAKEVGIRKVLGGVRSQLILQFLGETFLITAIAVLISMGASELIMKNMQELIGYNLSLDILNDTVLLTIVIGIVLLVTLLAGLYPSMVLARLKPSATLRSKGQSAISGNLNVRRGLVVFQFLISQFLVICTLVVISQMEYFQNKDLGFKKSGIITFPLPTQETDKMSTMKNRLMNFAGVEMVSYGFASPQSTNNIGSTFSYELVQGGANLDAAYKIVDENYVPLYEIEILAGRNFRESDSIDVAMISEDVMRLMEIDDPNDALGKVIGSGVINDKTIVGVFKSFHNNNLGEAIDPIIFVKFDEFYYEGAIRYSGSLASEKELIAYLEEVWTAQYPDVLFDYSKFTESIERQYQEEANTLSLYKIFSGIAILIGCLGLYGLVSFMANQKTKEIGIRKVLGASIGQILNIFSKELLILILIASLIAVPAGYYFMDNWLADFEYRIGLNMWVFAAAVLFTLLIGAITTGLRSLKAATLNPVESLRSE